MSDEVQEVLVTSDDRFALAGKGGAQDDVIVRIPGYLRLQGDRLDLLEAGAKQPHRLICLSGGDLDPVDQVPSDFLKDGGQGREQALETRREARPRPLHLERLTCHPKEGRRPPVVEGVVRPARFERATYRFVARSEGSSDHHQEEPSATKDEDSGHEDSGK